MALYGKLTKKYALVIPYFDKAIRLYPEYALTYAQYGAYLVTLGNLDAGLRLERAVAMGPELMFAHVWLAVAYKKKGNMNWAVKRNRKRESWDLKGRLQWSRWRTSRRKIAAVN